MTPIHQNRSESRLGRKLKAARKTAGTRQAELAALVGCSVRSVYMAEAGLGDLASFLRLAAALGMEPASRSLQSGPDLGSRLRATRKAAGLSRAELGRAASASPTTIATLENGGVGHLAVLERVAVALGAGLTLVAKGRSTSFFSLAASSACETWTTPQDVLDRLYRVTGGRFDLDPCSPLRGSRVRARTTYDELDDGLSRAWHGVVFMNPPYGRTMRAWMAKARTEAQVGRASLVIGLVPARTDTLWWHGEVSGFADVWLLRGRLRFGDGQQSAPSTLV